MCRVLLVLSVLVVATGCVSMPQGPNVMVLPGKSRSLSDFQRDDVFCRDYAAKQMQESPDASVAKSTAQSALITAVLGAAAGAVIGAVSGSPATGVAIGGASGGVLGAAGGAHAGQRAAMQLQQRFDQSYSQCMYAQGHSIPSIPVMSR